MSVIALRLPIIERAGILRAVDARNLHSWLDVGRDFSNWIKSRIDELGLVLGDDFEVFANAGENPLGGRPRVEYALTLDAAKHLAMVERNERGQQARAYFIEAEKRLRAVDPLVALSDPTTLRRLLGDYAERAERDAVEKLALRAETELERGARIAAEEKLAELDGAVALHERTKRASGTHGFREAAKIIGARPHDFVDFLVAESYCHRLGKRKRLVANERWTQLASPLFVVVHEELDHENGEVVRTHRTWLTDHGLEVLAGRFRAWLESKSRAA